MGMKINHKTNNRLKSKKEALYKRGNCEKKTESQTVCYYFSS